MLLPTQKKTTSTDDDKQSTEGRLVGQGFLDLDHGSKTDDRWYESQIEGLHSDLAEQRTQYIKLEEIQKALLYRLNEIQLSSSWQLSRPLRALERCLPKLVKALSVIGKAAWLTFSFSLPGHLIIRYQAREIQKEGLFNLAWYIQTYPDVVFRGLNPLLYWLSSGWKEGQDPNPLFDTRWYLEQNPDVARTGVNPLLHYLLVGAAEGRDPHPLFITNWYVDHNPAVVESGANPLSDYLNGQPGRTQDPHPLFNSAWYLSQFVGDYQPNSPPLVHYLNEGANNGLDPNPLFDTSWYLKNYSDVRRSGINPLLHYVYIGARNGNNPGPFFDAKWYADEYPEIELSDKNPFIHYLYVGVQQGLKPCPNYSSIPEEVWSFLENYCHAGRFKSHNNSLDSVQAPNCRSQTDARADYGVSLDFKLKKEEKTKVDLDMTFRNRMRRFLFNIKTQRSGVPVSSISARFIIRHMATLPEFNFERFKGSQKKHSPVLWHRLSVPQDRGLVSIVLPSFNGEDMIAEALDSLLNQTYEHLEIIAINDGSDDSTGRILDSYAEKDARIRVFHQTNAKLPRTLSKGFRLARGEYLTWTSIDNRLKPDCIEKMVESLVRNPKWDMIYANIDIIGDDGTPLIDSEWYKNYQTPSGSEHISLPKPVSELNVIPNNYIGAAFLYRQRVAWIIGDYSPARFLMEDYDYWMRVNELMTLRHADFDDFIYEYRFHCKSLTSKDEELGITKNRIKLMVFDEFRRSFLLSKSIWIVTHDDSRYGLAMANKAELEIQRREGVIINAMEIEHIKLPRLWAPIIFLHFAEKHNAITQEFRKFHISSQNVIVSRSVLADLPPNEWDMFITTAPVQPHALKRLDHDFKGWWSIPRIDDLISTCDIKAKNEQISAIECETYRLAECPIVARRIPLSVVVCTYNRSATLVNCLRSLILQTLPSWDYEVLVVNNLPSDKNPSIALSKLREEFSDRIMPDIVEIDCPLPGLSYARNAGLSEGRGDAVVFVDDDAIALPDCLEKIKDAFSKNLNVGVIGGHIKLYLTDPRPAVCPPGRESIWSEYITDFTGFTFVENWFEYPYGALWAARRELLLQMGGFRSNFGRVANDFGGGEEIVAAVIARNLGFKVGIEPAAVVMHDVELNRYTSEHVLKTISAGIISNYRMQMALYLPYEASFPKLFHEFVCAQRLRFDLLLRIRKTSSSDIDRLYATAYAKAKASVLLEYCRDTIQRIRMNH